MLYVLFLKNSLQKEPLKNSLHEFDPLKNSMK